MEKSGSRATFKNILLILVWQIVIFSINLQDADGLRKNQTIENETERVAIEQVEGVVGFRAELPCDIFTSRREDTVYMILWFRVSEGKPLYTFDVRGRGMNTAKTWSSKAGFDQRADFQPAAFPAHLLVNDLRMTDQGIYRCRVDFKNSRTRNALVNLTVVVPPSSPIIYNGSDEEVTSELGPYKEGVDVLLKCRVRGGKPEPVVSWYLNGALEDTTYYINGYGDVINEFLFKDVNRSHLHSQFTCKASNTRLIQPIERSVVLDLVLKPLFVRFRQKQIDQVVAGKEYRISCETAGSKPSAALKWIKGGKEITSVNTQELDDGNITISTLTLIPIPDDNGASLICRAENPSLNAKFVLEEVWHLNVVYLPEVDLSLGSTLNISEIKDGSDVYFECRIKANPKISKLEWLFNTNELKHNVGAGVIMSNQSLVLQGINRKAAGNYTCVASNSQGSKQSNGVFLSVMHAPVCIGESSITVGVTAGEITGLRCAVKSNPSTYNFEWEFHSSGDHIDVVPIGKTLSQADLSRFFYTPSDHSFGTFLCWGSNSVGRQLQPCVFHVVPAVKPNPLENCVILNQTETMIHVECSDQRELPTFLGSFPDHPISRTMNEESAEKSYQSQASEHGQFPEYYVMEVWDLKNRSVRRNLSAEAPVFILKGLIPGSWLKLILYAANSHGKSEPVIIEAVVAGGAEKAIFGVSRHKMDLFPLIAIGIGIAGVGLLLVLTIVFRSWLYTPSVQSRHLLRSNGNSTANTPALFEKRPHGNASVMLMTTLTKNSIRSYDSSKHGCEMMDQDPDVIPGDKSFPEGFENGNFCKATTFQKEFAVAFSPSSPHKKINVISAAEKLDYDDPLSVSSYTGFQPPLSTLQDNDNSHHFTFHRHDRPSNLTNIDSIYHDNSHQQEPLHTPISTLPNDYNTIYIRDKLLYDSQIPESCV